MPASELLRLIIQADTAGAVKGIERLGTSAEKNLGKVEDRTTRVGKNLQKFGAGAVVTGALFTGAMYKAGQSAADLEQAVGGTEAVFKDAKGPIEDYAKTAATGMGLSERAFREATTSLGGQLKALGVDVDEAATKSIELTGVAADLAATYGGTTAEAVQALGAAFRGEADPAERFNLRLNQNTVNAKAVAMGLAESTSQVDAQAKAQATLALITEQSADAQGQFAREADSAAGSMQIANAQFENAKASLGQAVAPIMADLAGKVSGLASGFQEANEKSGGLLSKLATFGAIGLTAGGAVSFVAGKVIEMRKQILGLPGPVKVAGAALGILGLVLFRASERADELKEASRSLRQEAESTGDSLEDVAKRQFAKSITESDKAREALANLGLSYEDLKGPLNGTAEELESWRRGLIESAEANGVATANVDALFVPLEKSRRALQEAKTATDASTEATTALGVSAEETSEELEEQVSTLEEVEEALLGAYEATLKQFDANLSYRKSIDDTEGSLADLLETQKEHGSNSEEYRDALLDAEGALLAQAEAAVRLYEDTAAAAGQTLSAKEKAKIYRDELVRLAAALAPGSPLRAQLQGYIDQLAKVPTSVDTRLNLSVSTRTVRNPDAFEGRAAGGPVNANQPYWVGERGKEVFVPDTDGTIIPNESATSARPASAGGGGDTIVNIYVSGSDPQAVVEAVSRYINSNGQPKWLRTAAA